MHRIPVLVLVAAVLALSPQALLNAGQLVRLNVAVTGRGGQAAKGLERGDFQLQEDGKPRNLLFVRFTGGEGPVTAANQAEFSNRRIAPPHVTVILLDLLNDAMMTGPIISEQLKRAVRNLPKGDELFLYFLTTKGELYAIHPLPKQVETKSAFELWEQNLPPLLDSALKELISFRQADDYDVQTRIGLTVQAMRELGTRMETIPGRQNLVWVTRSVPMNGYSQMQHVMVDFSVQIRAMSELLQHMQIAVYPVGAPLESESDLALAEIAGLTGGQKFGFGEVGKAIRQAAADSRGNYVVVYESMSEKTDGKHHKLHLTCTRKDVRVQTLSGLDDLVDFPDPKASDQKTLKLATHSLFDTTDIGVGVTVTKSPPPQDKALFDVRIDAADLALHEVQGRRTGQIAVLFASFGPSGLLDTLRADQPDFLQVTPEVQLTPEQYETALREGLHVSQTITLSADLRHVRVIVLNRELGAVGSVTVPIHR